MDPPITREEFWELVKASRYLVAKRGQPFNYACMDGVNKVAGSIGLLDVPLPNNLQFLRLVSRAVRGGALLCLHQERSKPLAPLFFDFDCKDLFGLATDDDTVCQQLYALFRDTLFATCKDAWYAHVGLPRMIEERFPGLKTIKDVFEALNANANVMSASEPFIPLCNVFRMSPDCLNWLTRNLAVALACVAQTVVRRYYPSRDPHDPVFTCFAFFNYSEDTSSRSPATKCRVGAHLHFPAIVTVENAQDIGQALAQHMAAKYSIMGGMVDNDVHAHGIRMPYNFKPQMDEAQPIKRKRLLDPDGFAQVVRRYYKPAALVKPDGTCDVSSKSGKQFLNDVFVALVAANIRTTAPVATPGFDNTDLPTAPREPPKPETGKDVFDKLEGVTPAWRARVKKLAEQYDESDPRRNDVYAQYTSYLTAVGAEGLASKRAFHVPTFEPAGESVARVFSNLLVLVFGAAFQGTRVTGLIYHPSGYARTNGRKALLVFTDTTYCFNKSPTGTQAQPHGNGRKHSWFVLDADDQSVTQLCSNESSHQGHLRASRTRCKDWPGFTVKADAMTSSDAAARVRVCLKGIFDQLGTLAK